MARHRAATRRRTLATVGLVAGVCLLGTAAAATADTEAAATAEAGTAETPDTGAAESAEVETVSGVTLEEVPHKSSTDVGLSQLNLIRGVAGLMPVRRDAALTAGAREHARYVLATGEVGHTQDPTHAFATADGAESAARSNVMLSTDNEPVGRRGMVDLMQVAPFHGLQHLRASVASVGIGYAADGGREAMVIDVTGGRDASIRPPDHPIAFPGPGSTTRLRSYTGGEFPDPLAPCEGWRAPTGAPIMITFPDASTVDAVDVTGPDGAALETCWYDSDRFTDDDGDRQATGRTVLANQHAVVIMPRDPLETGRHRVLLDGGDAGPSTWSFTVGADHRPATGWVQQRPEQDEKLAGVCPHASLPPSMFDDVPPGTHAHAIACGVVWELLSGTSTVTFEPATPVTRGQAATLLFRLMTAAGDSTSVQADRQGQTDLGFSDVTSAHTHQEAIHALASWGILTGREDGSFGPSEPVTRAQLVAAISRTLDLRFERPPPEATTSRFDDVPPGSVHHRSIEHLADLGIVVGVDDDSFGPNRSVRRDHAAAFVLRTAVQLVGYGELPPPD